MASEDNSEQTSLAGSRWTEVDLANARSVKESMDSVHAFCGLMAGFEGFIINEYVNSNGNASEEVFDADGSLVYEEPFSDIFQWGLFMFIFSFSLNLAVAMMSFLWGVFLKEGTYRLWFMTIVGRATKFMATLGVITFCLGVLLFVETIGLDSGFVIVIYLTATVLFSVIMAGFLYTTFFIAFAEPEKDWKAVMEHVNG